MGHLQGTQINKLDSGLNRENSTNDSIVLLVGSISTGTAQITHGKVIKLIQTKDAEDLGINESFDANHKVLAHYHISEVFRLAPNATVYFLPVAENSSIESVKAQVISAIKENSEIKGVGYFGFTNDLTSVVEQVDGVANLFG